jgi:hypothetical protein
MPYMLLIIEPKGQRRERSEAEGRALFESMLRFSDQLKSRGLLLASQSLRSDDQATRVQVRNGRASLTDGPFAEAKEIVGGYFLLDTEDRAQAVEIASACPAAAWATVEVREFGPCFT